MCGALMPLTGSGPPRAYTLEEFDPDPYLDALVGMACPALREPRPGSGGLMRLAELIACRPLQGWQNLSQRLRFTSPAHPCYLLDEASCASTARSWLGVQQ